MNVDCDYSNAHVDVFPAVKSNHNNRTGARRRVPIYSMKNKVYLFDNSERTAQGGFPVYVGYEAADGKTKHVEELCPAPSQALINHSPNGFNWGYGGSGAAQCALGILLDVTGNRAIALRWYQDFKNEVIAHIPTGKKVQISQEKVRDWLTTKTKERR